MAAAVSGPTKCEGLWFPDGDIIFETKKKRFRVNRNKLEEISPVFRDRMDAVEGKPPKHKRHPKIRLEHDSDELELLLTAIYDPHSFARKIKSPSGVIDFSVLEATLRMSTQFEVTYLRKMLIKQLTMICPTFLEVYDTSRRSLTTTNLSPAKLPFAIVRLAREADVCAVLPFALYCCSTQPLQYLLDGDIDWEDKKACLVARQELHNRLRTSIFGFLLGRNNKDAPIHCKSPTKCKQERLAFLSRNESSFASWKKGPIEYEVDWQAVSKLFCISCTVMFRVTFERARQDIWNGLPALFGLPPWQKLLFAKVR